MPLQSLCRFVVLTLFASAWPLAHAGLDEGLAAVKARDYATAVREFTPLAERDDQVAQRNLAMLYGLGLGVPKDSAKSVALDTKAAEHGYPASEYNLGVDYMSGDGVAKDMTQALAWLHKAADHGYPKALHAIGFLYERGNGVPQDFAQAVDWYRRAIAAGNASSVYNLGVIYANGRPGVPRDLPMAWAVFSIAVPQDASSAGYRDLLGARLDADQAKHARDLAAGMRLGAPLP
jgi:TPR repeat protein